GSGQTGLAAALKGRRAYLSDLSPAATFISKNYCTPLRDDLSLLSVVSLWEPELKSELSWLFSTRCRRCSAEAQIEYVVWEECRRCRRCGTTLGFFVARRHGGRFYCHRCDDALRRSELDFVCARPVLLKYSCAF